MDHCTEDTRAFLRYIHGDASLYSQLLRSECINTSCKALAINAILERVHCEENGDWKEAITALTSLLSVKKQGEYSATIVLPSQERDRLTDLIIYFDIIILYRQGDMFDTARHFIESVLAELKETEHVARICYLFLHCEVQLDEFVANGKSVDWVQNSLHPLLSEVQSLLAKQTFSPVTKQVLLYRYHLILSIQMIISGNMKGLKKSITGVTQNQFRSLSAYEAEIGAEMTAIRQKDEFDSAQLLLSQYSQHNSFFINHQLLKSYLEYNRGNYTKIVSFCCNGSPRDVARLSLLGSSQFAMGHGSLALSYYQQILHIHPAFDRSLYGSVYRNMGIIYCALNDFGASRICFRHALSCLPRNAWIWYYYGETLAKAAVKHPSRAMLREVEMAMQSALQLSTTEELRVVCLSRLAWVKLRLGDFGGACSVCDQVEPIMEGSVRQRQLVRLYRVEGLVGQGEVRRALAQVDPQARPELYPEWIVRAVREKRVDGIEEKVDEIEKRANGREERVNGREEKANEREMREKEYPSQSLCETLLVNNVVLAVRCQDLEKAAVLSEVCWKAFPSPRNQKLFAYVLLLNGRGKEAMKHNRLCVC